MKWRREVQKKAVFFLLSIAPAASLLFIPVSITASHRGLVYSSGGIKQVDGGGVVGTSSSPARSDLSVCSVGSKAQASHHQKGFITAETL